MQKPATPAVLELVAPEKVKAGSGYLKIKANAGTGTVAWDVFAVFADPAVKVQWEAIGADTLILGIPASPGLSQ